MERRTRIRLTRYAIYAATILVVGFVAVRADWGSLQEAFLDPEIFAEQFWDILTIAAKNTLIYTLLGYTLGLVWGLVLALMRLSTITPYRWFATTYIEIFRGIPLLLTLLIIGYGLPIALNGTKVPGTYGPGAVALGVVAAAYLAETIRAGIEAVPRGQMEAARSLGMSYGRAMATIVIPQAFRIIVPPLTNELVLLIKDTSLVSVLGTTQLTEELTKFARDNASSTFNSTPYIAAALVYLCLTVPLTRLSATLEKRGKRGNR
ncbi:MAG: amino acid ABC transporter permease [Acidimicrobiales bacterium]|jgi:polar amino acid transport system permease protein|nr:amino acid ABC transporter permease [Acidimicrobiales bacterium]